MNITIVIRTTAPNTAAAQGIYDSIIARLQNISDLKITAQLNEELVTPLPAEPPE